MDNDKKIEYWLDIAEYDLNTAESLQNSDRYLYTIFMCEQAIEKILKAVYLKKSGKDAPRTHNLPYLNSLLNLETSERFLRLFGELTSYYIETRYPDYRHKLSTLIDNKKAQNILSLSKECFQWLKLILKS